jgi:hypothetical protein
MHNAAALQLLHNVRLGLKPPTVLATFRGCVAPGALVSAELVIPYALLRYDPNGTGCLRFRLECKATRPRAADDGDAAWKRLPVTLRARWPREAAPGRAGDAVAANAQMSGKFGAAATAADDDMYASRTRDVAVPHSDGDWLRVSAGLLRLPKTDRDRGRGFVVPSKGQITLYLFQVLEKGRAKERGKRRSSTGSADAPGTPRGKTSKLSSIASNDGPSMATEEDMGSNDAFELARESGSPKASSPASTGRVEAGRRYSVMHGCTEPLPPDHHLVASFTLQGQ